MLYHNLYVWGGPIISFSKAAAGWSDNVLCRQKELLKIKISTRLYIITFYIQLYCIDVFGKAIE